MTTEAPLQVTSWLAIPRDELETCLSVLIRMTANLNLELQEGEG